jgi:hypothetical protein
MVSFLAPTGFVLGVLSHIIIPAFARGPQGFFGLGEAGVEIPYFRKKLLPDFGPNIQKYHPLFSQKYY